jgi:hypothetical protein
MFDCLLYSTRPERAPTPLESWAAQEAKSETTADDLRLQVAALGARAVLRRRRAIRDAMLMLSACAAAAVGCLM